MIEIAQVMVLFLGFQPLVPVGCAALYGPYQYISGCMFKTGELNH